jgi:molecular chaperone DnaK (HSP70)
MTVSEIDHRYIIGIDLGTTNSAISYVDLQAQTQDSTQQDKKPPIKLFKVAQLTGPGEVSRLEVLPSFLYIPGKYDLDKDALAVPWETRDQNFAGAFARDHGAKVPARLVSSAKSWLCHGNVDKRARMLPWGAGDDVYKVSPVEATAAYLTHLKNAWNAAQDQVEENYLENQLVIVTVPASFDEVARDLTVEATKMAGLREVVLLEEPLAAFYSWLQRYENNWHQQVSPGELILVCDVGGGTTDFTLITLREADGTPRFERIAVGDHLILGGDNVDLALARQVELKMGKGRQVLSGDRWKTLCHQCRQAKERILGGISDTEKITIMGEGSKLIAGTLSASLDRDTVEQIVVDGFFPLADAAGPNISADRKGITEFGLPYEQEPAITRQLGWFLEKHQQDVANFIQKERAMPDLVLFNGGSLKPDIIRERIRTAVRHWFKAEDTRMPRILDNPNPDLAVALGAAYYGLVKVGGGVRVGSGSPRAYYMGVGEATETSVEERKAICLVERGLDEGSHISLAGREFEVRTNQPVAFDMYSSSFRSGDRCGDMVTIDDTLTTLPPIKTVVTYGKKGNKARLPVGIEADYTEIGTLALWCRSNVSPHRWQLQFQLRDSEKNQDVGESEIVEESVVAAMREKISTAFSKSTPPAQLETLVKKLTAEIEKPRDKWPLGLIRTLVDEIVKRQNVRGTAPEFESRWLNLVGFFMRPGFGDGYDPQRIKALWKIHHSGLMHGKNAQVRAEWWIMWRRVAGGLNPGQQRQFIQERLPLLIPKPKQKVRMSPQERLELWMAAANMERLLVKDKVALGRALLKELRPKKAKPQQFWALSRLGARVLLYGPDDRVVPASEVAKWCRQLMERNWRSPVPVGAALAQMARRTGDRVRDLDEKLISQIMEWMTEHKIAPRHIRILREVRPVARVEENVQFGDTLPAGIILKGE